MATIVATTPIPIIRINANIGSPYAPATETYLPSRDAAGSPGTIQVNAQTGNIDSRDRTGAAAQIVVVPGSPPTIATRDRLGNTGTIDLVEVP